MRFIITEPCSPGADIGVIYIEAAQVGNFEALVEVTGSAHITGMHTYAVDPNDPLKNGFCLSG